MKKTRLKCRHNLKSLSIFARSFQLVKMKLMPKCVELSTSPNAIKQKLKKVDLGNSILKNDVIHDALRVICNKNLKLRGRFGDLGTGSILV
jgi:hypothetical protein